MKVSRDIPEGWVIASVGDVCSKPQYGYTTKASDTGDLRLLRTSDITSGRINWETVPYCSENPSDFEKYVVAEGDILVSRAGSVGVSHLVTSPQRAIFASYLIRFTPFINKQFLAYFLKSPNYWDAIGDETLGIAVPNVNATKLKSIILPIPPADEQHRIVSKIDELFSELDKGVESLRTAQAQLKVYRQAVLKQAFNGKLTAKWREDNEDMLETAEQLLAQVKRKREAHYEQQLREWKVAVDRWENGANLGKRPARPRKPRRLLDIPASTRTNLPELPDGWTWTRLGNISIVSGGLTKNPDRTKFPRKMKYLRVANVYADKVLTDDVHEIGVTDSEAKTVTLEAGDLLVVEGNGSINQIGRVALWDGELAHCGHQNHLIRIRLLEGALPRFFLQFLLSPLGRELIVSEASSTSGLHTLSISKMSNLIVPVASSAEQSTVVAWIEERVSKVDEAIGDIESQLFASEALRQSTLKKAFSGELVEQNPNDEPAAVLLERIKAEKVGQAPKPRARKRKAGNVHRHSAK